MSYQKLDPDSIRIHPNSQVTLTTMGNILEIKYMSRRNNSSHVTKISNDEYMVNDTGEIKTYRKEKSKTRKDSLNSLRKTFHNIRTLILTNVTDNSRVRWCTLTYAENMQDTERLYNDFRKFFMRFRAYCNAEAWGNVEYLAIVEPQGRGAFHWHCLFIFTDHPAPFIPKPILEKLWGHGFVHIKSVNGVDNIAAYLSAYLTNAEISPELVDYFDSDEVIEVVTDSKKHYYIKNSRLGMYPAYLNIIRHSRGIKKPVVEQMTMYEALQQVKGMYLKYQSCGNYSDDKGFSTIIKKMEYKKKRED